MSKETLEKLNKIFEEGMEYGEYDYLNIDNVYAFYDEEMFDYFISTLEENDIKYTSADDSYYGRYLVRIDD